MANESSVLVRLRLLGASAFAREASSAGRSLGKIERAGKRSDRALGVVNKGLGVGAAAMRGVGLAAGAAAATGIAYGIKSSANFEQSMANVQARLLTTKGNMNLLSQQALDLGAKTQYSAQQAADAMNEFAAAGFNTKQIMGLMPGTLNLAAASGEDLATTAELQGAMMRQFGLHAKDANHVADALTVAVNKSAIGMDDLGLTMKYVGPVAGRFHQSIEDIAGSAAILGNVGIKGETAGTTLRRAFVNLVRPSKKTIDTLDGMGISVKDMSKATTDAKGNLRPFPQIIGNLAGQMADLSKPQKRKALAQLFGVEALPGMLTLFGKGRKQIEKMSASLQHSGGAAKRTAGIMRGTVKGAWDNFTGSVETAAIRLTRRFNPAMKHALGFASDFVNKGTNVVSDFVGGLAGEAPARRAPKAGPRTAGGARASMGETKPQGKAAAKGSEVRGIIGGIADQAKKLGPVVVDAGKQLVDAFKPALPFFQNVLLPLLKGVAAGLLGGVVFAFKLAVPIIKVVATVLGAVGTFLKPLKPLFFALGVVIGTIAGGPILSFLGKLKYVGVVFKILAVPIRVAQGLFKLLAGGVIRLVGSFLRVLTSAQRFAAFFTSLPGRVIRAALNVVGGIVHTIETLPGKLVSIAKRGGTRLISGLANGVRGKIGSIVAFFGRIGRSIIDALVAAIKAAPGVIWEAIKSIAGPAGRLLDRVFGGGGGGAPKAHSAGGDRPGMATGGRVSRGGWAVVGERGPELARFGTGDTVYDSRQTARARAAMASPAPTVLHAHLYLSGKQIHSEVFRVDRQMVEAT